MSKIIILEKARQELRAQLAQIKRNLPPRAAAAQFYGTLSYPAQGKEYEDYIKDLHARPPRQLGARELNDLITNEFNCNYDFTCGEQMNFNTLRPAPWKITEALSVARDRIVAAYFTEQDYEKCLTLIAARPTVTEYEIIAALHVKCLLWRGRFQECVEVITNCHCPAEISAPGTRIFYLLQRALSYWHTGELNKACLDCNAAWISAQGAAGRPQEQLPAILWLRALITQELGDNERARCDMEKTAGNQSSRAKACAALGATGPALHKTML